MDINQINLLGNVSSEPKFSKTNNNNGVVNFSLATNEKWKDKNTGELTEKAQFTNIVFWQPPEFMKKALKKGSRVLINNGKLQTSSWEKDGETFYKTEVVVSQGQGDVIVLSKKEEK